MSTTDTSPKVPDNECRGRADVDDDGGMNWDEVRAMTDEEVRARALSDPDNPPTPPDRLVKMRRISPARFIRQKLGMSEEAFAAAYGIPLDTLKAWERHEAEPGRVELAYLRAIERSPEATRVPEPV